MSDLDLLALIPEKFRSSQLLVDLLEVVSERLVDQAFRSDQVGRVGGSLQESLTSLDTEMVLREDYAFPADRPISLIIWNDSSPSLSPTQEIVRATLLSDGRFALERGLHGTSPSNHPTGSVLVPYIPFSLKEISSKIDGMERLVNPRFVPGEYLQKLASLLGATLQSPEYTEERVRRNELLSMIDWYRVKGTYDSINVIQLITGLDFKLFDLYTNDYQTFIRTEWSVENEGENPFPAWGFVDLEESWQEATVLDSSYYKSPHFGLYVRLNKVYLADDYNGHPYPNHIWRPELFGIPDVPESSVSNYIEKTRPVNTVPHYGTYLECETDQSGVPLITFDRNLEPLTATAVTNLWEYDNVYFDEQESPGNTFDETLNFDTSVEAFISSITHWKVGTSGKFLIWQNPVITLDTPKGGGRVEGYRIYPNRFEFYVTLAKEFVAEGDEKGITELGLFRGDEGDMVLLATFPALFKDDSLEALVKIIVHRTKDPNQFKQVLNVDADLELMDTIVIDVHCVATCGGTEIEAEEV